MDLGASKCSDTLPTLSAILIQANTVASTSGQYQPTLLPSIRPYSPVEAHITKMQAANLVRKAHRSGLSCKQHAAPRHRVASWIMGASKAGRRTLVIRAAGEVMAPDAYCCVVSTNADAKQAPADHHMYAGQNLAITAVHIFSTDLIPVPLAELSFLHPSPLSCNLMSSRHGSTACLLLHFTGIAAQHSCAIGGLCCAGTVTLLHKERGWPFG